MSSAALTSEIVRFRDSSIFPERFLAALMKALENSTFIHQAISRIPLALSCLRGRDLRDVPWPVGRRTWHLRSCRRWR